MGIWAVKELGATSAQLSYGYLVMAAVGGVVGYVAGHLSDHFGRRRVILFGQGILAVYVLLFLARRPPRLVRARPDGGRRRARLVRRLGRAGDGGRSRAAGAARGGVCLGARGGEPRRHDGPADREPVPARRRLDAVLPLRQPARPHAPGCSRSATCRSAAPTPRRGRRSGLARASSSTTARSSSSWLASVFAWVVYVAYETVLPISLVESHGDPAVGLGLPARRQPAPRDPVPAPPDPPRRRDVGMRRKWVVAMLLMGLAVPPPRRRARLLPVIVVVLVLFVIGEMLWVPISQSVVAGLAPEDLRGAYMGAFGGTAAMGFALAPFLGLQVRSAAGDTAMWAAFAVVAVVGGGARGVACRGVGRRRTRARPALLYLRHEARGARADPQAGRRLGRDARATGASARRSPRTSGRRGSGAGRCGCGSATSGPRPTATSPRSAGRCRSWSGSARSRS